MQDLVCVMGGVGGGGGRGGGFCVSEAKIIPNLRFQFP